MGKRGQDAHLQTIVEVLQSIKASDMTPLLRQILNSPSGSELLDVLMKYLYKGMSIGAPPKTPIKITPQSTGFSQVGSRSLGVNEGVTAAMSVLLSWHEKVVEVGGIGCIVRCMTDRRRV
jgi:actin related protein 2/3 complex subunit 5